MRKWMRRAGLTLGAIVGLLVLVVVASHVVVSLKLRKHYTVAATTLVLPADSAAIARGKLIAEMRGCTECHTPTFQGAVMFDQFPMGRIASANLTRGKGGAGATFSDADWERAIRHGVRPDGTPLVVMPSEEFKDMSDADLAQLIAYLKSVPPVDNVLPPNVIWPLGRVMLAGGVFKLGAEVIDHDAPRVSPRPGVTVEYGRYLAQACASCHGPALTGSSGGPPGSSPTPNLTPSGAVGRWTEADFIRTLRTGETPDGRKLDKTKMPWPAIGRLTDDELRAIWMYVHSLPVKTASR